MEHYDIVVIGAGAGGITAAVNGVGFGKKVLLIEQHKPGGECTWFGCVPSKALINEAKKVHIIRQNVPQYTYDSHEAMEHVRRVRAEVYSHESPETLEKMGIVYMQGSAQFTAPNKLLVGGKEVSAAKIVIATGSSAFIPPIPGLDKVDYLSNETIFELERLPESMIILGGGAIGVELAQAINRLGVKVQLVEMMSTILFREEMDLVLPLQKQLEDEGVELYLGAKATKVEKKGSDIALTYESQEKNGLLQAKSILVAVGRKPNIENLKLEAAKIRYDRRGIAVNKNMQTSAKKVYAVGDVTGPYQFSHMANHQAIQAAQNAILPFKRAVSYKHVAWVTFTEPELARAGLTEAEAREQQGDNISVYNFDMNDLDRTRTKGPSIERVKLILDKSGKILGASVLAERAGEMIAEVQVIKSMGIKYRKLSGIIHPYPCYAEAFQKLGKTVMVASILNNPIVKLVRKLRK